MKLLILGLAGVIVACLIFVSVIALPWSGLTSSLFTVSPDTPVFPTTSNATIVTDVSISSFTEPGGPNSEANMTISIISKKDVQNVKVQVVVSSLYVGQGVWPNVTWTPIGPRGIDLVGGNSTWVIDLVANVSTSITMKVKATEIGLGAISASATWFETPSAFFKSEDALYVRVYEHEVVVYDSNPPLL